MTNLVFGDYNKDDLKKLYDNNPALTQNLSVTKLSSSIIKYIKLILSNGFETTDMLIGPDWMVEVIYYDQGELFYVIGRTLPIRSSESITIDCSHDYHKEIKTVAVANIRHIKILDPEDPAVKGGIHLSLIELNKLLGITPPAPTPKPGKEPGQDPKIIDPSVPGKKDPDKKDEGTGTEPKPQPNPGKKDEGTQTEPETPGIEPKPQPEDPAKPGKKDEGTQTEPETPGVEPKPQPQPEDPAKPGETPGTEQPGTDPNKKDENIPSSTLDPVIDAKTMETKPEGYHVVSFVIENGTFTGSDRFFVKHGTPWMRITPPGAKPKPGYQIVSWNKTFPTTVEEDIELAEVCELKSVVKESEIGHRPEGYYKLTIKHGEGVTLPEGDEVWYAKLDATLNIEVHPTILQGYNLVPYDIPQHMPATDVEVLIYAVPIEQPKPLAPTEDILPAEGEKPKGYSEVSFNLTEAVPNATVTRYYVKNGTPFEKITVPTGFTVSPLYITDNRFLPAFPSNVTEDVVFTLNVIKKAIVPSKALESKPEGYHSYVFKLHEHMTVEESTELSYYVATNTKKEDAPKVDAKANDGYVLTETVINPDNDKITTDVEVSYKVYPEIVPVNEVGVKPNGYHSVSYVAGNDKARVSGVTQYFTADGVDIDNVPEPTVDIDEECILSKTIEPPMQGKAISNDIVVTYTASLEVYDASLNGGETPAGYHKVTFARNPGSVEVPGLTLPTFNVAHGIDLAKVLKKVKTTHGEYTIVLHETSGAVVADKEVIYTAYPEIIKNPSSDLTIPGYAKVEYVVDEHTELKFDIGSTYYINMRNDEEAFKTKIAGTTIVGPDDITVKDEGYALDEPVWATPELVDGVYKVKVRVKTLPVKPKYILAEEASEELKNSGEYSLISYAESEGIIANPKPFYILKTLNVTEAPMLTKDVKLKENYEIVSIKIPPVTAVEDETIKTPSDITVTLVAYPPVKEYTDQKKHDGYHMVEVKYPHSNIKDESYIVRHGAIITNYITLKPTTIAPGWERKDWVDVDKPIVADTVFKYECKRVAYTEADKVVTTDKLEPRPDGYYSFTVRTAYPEGYGEYIMNAHIKNDVPLDHPEISKMINDAKALAHEGDNVIESYSPFMPKLSSIKEFTLTLYIAGHEPIIKLPDSSPDYANINVYANRSMLKDESSNISVSVKKGAKISELKLDDILKLIKNEFKPGYNIVSHNWITMMSVPDGSPISGVEADGDTIKDNIKLNLTGLPDVIKYIKHENSGHITYEVDGAIFDEKPEGYVAVSLAAEYDSSNKVIDLLVKNGTPSSKIQLHDMEVVAKGYKLTGDLKWNLPSVITSDINAKVLNRDVIKIDEDADIIDCKYDDLKEKPGYNKFSVTITQNSVESPLEKKKSGSHDYLVKSGIRRDNPVIMDIIKENKNSSEMLRKISEGYSDSESELITNDLVYNFEYEYILYSSEKINHNYSKIIPYIPEGSTVKPKELYGVIGCELKYIPIDKFDFNATEFDTDIYESIQYKTSKTDGIRVHDGDNIIHPDIVYKDVIPTTKLKSMPDGYSLVNIDGAFDGEYSVHNKSNSFYINRSNVDLLTSPTMEPIYNSFKFEISDDEVFIKDMNENIESNKVYIRVAKKIVEGNVLTDEYRNNKFHMLTIASRIPAAIAHANYIVHESADLSKIDKSAITVTGLPSYVESYSITLPERIGTSDQTVYVDYERKDILNTSDYKEKPEGYFTLTYKSDIEGFVEKAHYIESGVKIDTLNLAEFAPTPADASYTVEYTKSSDQTTMDADMIVTYVKNPKILLSEDDVTKYGGPKYKTISFNSGLTDQSMFEGIDKTYSVRSDVNPTDVAQFITLPTLKNTDLVTSATFTLPNEVMGDADRVVKPAMEFINIVPVSKFAEGRPEGYIKVTFAPNEIFTNEPLHSTGVEIYAKPGTTELQNYESTLDLTYDTSVHKLTNHFDSNIKADTVMTYTFTNNN